MSSKDHQPDGNLVITIVCKSYTIFYVIFNGTFSKVINSFISTQFLYNFNKKVYKIG